MSRVIALEASTENCSVAVLDGASSCFLSSDKPRSHASVLLPMLDELLARAGVSLSSIDAIAVTHGPGSFTGIRICLSLAQGLAFGAGLPVVPVSTLELLAYQAVKAGLNRFDSDLPCQIIPMIDARMNEIYWAVYRAEGDTLYEMGAPAVNSGDHIDRELAGIKDTAHFVGVGGGWALKATRRDFLATCDENMVPNARDLAFMAEKLMGEGRMFDVADVQPLYLRNEVSWNKRTRIRNG